MITEKDIESLAELSRIALPEGECASLKNDLERILEYVGELQAVDTSGVKDVRGDVAKNVLRDDEAPHASGEYTDTLLSSAPHSSEGYVVVKKIL